MNEIDQLFTDWMEATRRGDVDALTEMVTDDAEFWSPGAPAMRGRETVSVMFHAAFSKYSLERSWNEIERLLGNDFMVSVGIEKTRLTPRGGGDPIDVTQRGWTMARRCPDGRWRFARGITNRET